MDQALNQKIDAFIAANKEQWLKDIEALVSINSVESTPAEGAPFGQGARAALDKTLELAAGMGFATRNCENYIGYAELPGADAEKYLATICHVDVVPEGNGWTGDPFQMEVRDGCSSVAVWPTTKAHDHHPVCPEVPQGAGLFAQVPHPRPRRRQRGDQHGRCEVLPQALPGPGLLLHPGCGVPGLQRRKRTLRRGADQPGLQR